MTDVAAARAARLRAHVGHELRLVPTLKRVILCCITCSSGDPLQCMLTDWIDPEGDTMASMNLAAMIIRTLETRGPLTPLVLQDSIERELADKPFTQHITPRAGYQQAIRWLEGRAIISLRDGAYQIQPASDWK